MSRDSKSMCVDHCEMVKVAKSAKSYYYSLETQLKHATDTVSELKKQLKSARKELHEISEELKCQGIIVDVLEKLCNHEGVHVLKGEDEVVDLANSDEDHNPMGTNELNVSYTFGASAEKSNTITPVKEGVSKRMRQSVDGSDDLLNLKPANGYDSEDFYSTRSGVRGAGCNKKSGPLKSDDGVCDSDADVSY